MTSITRASLRSFKQLSILYFMIEVCFSRSYTQKKQQIWRDLLFFCVYDEPSTDLYLHKNLYLANVHHRAFKRDGVQSIQIEPEPAYSISGMKIISVSIIF